MVNIDTSLVDDDKRLAKEISTRIALINRTFESMNIRLEIPTSVPEHIRKKRAIIPGPRIAIYGSHIMLLTEKWTFYLFEHHKDQIPALRRAFLRLEKILGISTAIVVVNWKRGSI